MPEYNLEDNSGFYLLESGGALLLESSGGAVEVHHYVADPDTTNSAGPYPTTGATSFTPVEGERLFVIVPSTDTVATGSVTASANGMTFTKADTALKGASGDTMYLFVSDQLVPSSPVSMTCTFSCTGDNATGAIVIVVGILGGTKVGVTAVKQTAKQENQSGGITPQVTFGAACTPGNPLLFCVLLTSALGGNTGPAGWVLEADPFYSTPGTGGPYASLVAGSSGATFNWGASVTGANCSLAVEVDVS